MSDVTRILSAIEDGDPEALALARKAAELTPEVWPPPAPPSEQQSDRRSRVIPPPNAQVTLGAALYRTADCRGAADTLTEALALPDDGRLFFLLAMTHWRLDHRTEARQVVRKGRPIDGTGPAARCRDVPPPV
jgi:hypothetical protein